jgi:hypothetical protein
MIAPQIRTSTKAPAPIASAPAHYLSESRNGTGSSIYFDMSEAHHFAHGRGGSGCGNGNCRGVCSNSVDDRVGASVCKNIGSERLLQDSGRTSDARATRRYFTECSWTIFSRRARSAAAAGSELPLLSTCWTMQGGSEVRGFDGVDHCIVPGRKPDGSDARLRFATLARGNRHFSGTPFLCHL